MTTQIVLVPGFWLGAWAWDAVTPRLRDDGFSAQALTLPGLSETSPDATATLDHHTDAIVAALDPDADRRVLVVHSGAAAPGTMVLDRDPGLVDHVVYVDTAPVANGYAMNPDLDGDSLPLEAVFEAEREEGSMRDLTEEQLQTFRAARSRSRARRFASPSSSATTAVSTCPAPSSAPPSPPPTTRPTPSRALRSCRGSGSSAGWSSSTCTRATGRCGPGRTSWQR